MIYGSHTAGVRRKTRGRRGSSSNSSSVASMLANDVDTQAANRLTAPMYVNLPGGSQDSVNWYLPHLHAACIIEVALSHACIAR